MLCVTDHHLEGEGVMILQRCKIRGAFRTRCLHCLTGMSAVVASSEAAMHLRNPCASLLLGPSAVAAENHGADGMMTEERMAEVMAVMIAEGGRSVDARVMTEILVMGAIVEAKEGLQGVEIEEGDIEMVMRTEMTVVESRKELLRMAMSVMMEIVVVGRLTLPMCSDGERCDRTLSVVPRRSCT